MIRPVPVLASCVLAALSAGLFLDRRSLIDPFRAIDRRALLGVFLLLAVGSLVLKPMVFHGIWHEQHAVGIVLNIEEGAGEGGFDSLHGPTPTLVLRSLHRAFLRKVSVFSINFWISIASAALLFFLVFLASGDFWAAVGSAALLILLPGRLRAAASEDLFVVVEFFSLLTTLLLLLFKKTNKPSHLLLAVLSLALLMQSRAEMMLLGPLLALTLALPTRRVRMLVAAFAGLALLCAPRIWHMASHPDPRMARLSWSWPGLTGLNAFFDPMYTPPESILLFLIGAVILFRKDRRVFGWLTAQWAVPTLFYLGHLTCLSLRLRTSLASAWALAAVAGFGLGWIVRSRPRIGLVFGAALLLVPWRYGRVLRTPTAKQEEFEFLERAASLLPERSAVVYLSEADEPELLQDRAYQRDLLASRARKLGKGVMATGIRGFLAGARSPALKDCYFYEGIACYTLPWTRSATDPAMGTRPEYVDPLCRRMGGEPGLEPVLQARVTGPSNSWDRVEGEGRLIGLYRIPEGRCGGLLSEELAARLPAAALEELERSFQAFDERRPVDGFRSYHRALDAAPQRLPEALELFCRASRTACSKLETAKAELEALNDEGIRLFQAGDLSAAAAAFDRALALDSRDLDALMNRGAAAAAAGQAPQARGFYRRAVAEAPEGSAASRQARAIVSSP